MGVCAALRARGRWAVNWLYLVGAVLAVLLFAYLVAALLAPEKFS